MEFVKIGKKYLIKGSNGRVISEKEKLQLENKELVLKDIQGCECQQETTKKISKNKKRLKEIEKEEQWAVVEEKDNKIHIRPVVNGNIIETPIEKIENTATTEKEVDVDDTIEETDKSI